MIPGLSGLGGILGGQLGQLQGMARGLNIRQLMGGQSGIGGAGANMPASQVSTAGAELRRQIERLERQLADSHDNAVIADLNNRLKGLRAELAAAGGMATGAQNQMGAAISTGNGATTAAQLGAVQAGRVGAGAGAAVGAGAGVNTGIRKQAVDVDLGGAGLEV